MWAKGRISLVHSDFSDTANPFGKAGKRKEKTCYKVLIFLAFCAITKIKGCKNQPKQNVSVLHPIEVKFCFPVDLHV